jgi:hypothetical protein
MDTKDLRASGDATKVRVELEGHWRWVFVTREAIDDHLLLSPERAAKMTPDDRCDWVREHLADVYAATRKKLIDPNDVGNIILGTDDF